MKNKYADGSTPSWNTALTDLPYSDGKTQHWGTPPPHLGGPETPPMSDDQIGVLGSSPFKPRTVWLSEWYMEVIDIGAGVVTVRATGSDSSITVPVEGAMPALGKTAVVAFGDGGKVAVVGVAAGS